jgi:hypothetical protein
MHARTRARRKSPRCSLPDHDSYRSQRAGAPVLAPVSASFTAAASMNSHSPSALFALAADRDHCSRARRAIHVCRKSRQLHSCPQLIFTRPQAATYVCAPPSASFHICRKPRHVCVAVLRSHSPSVTADLIARTTRAAPSGQHALPLRRSPGSGHLAAPGNWTPGAAVRVTPPTSLFITRPEYLPHADVAVNRVVKILRSRIDHCSGRRRTSHGRPN